MTVRQADIHLIKSRLIVHTEQARTWANNPNLCTDKVCASVMNQHCENLGIVVSMLTELEQIVTTPADDQLETLQIRGSAYRIFGDQDENAI